MRKVLIFTLVLIVLCVTLFGCAYQQDDKDSEIQVSICKTENQPNLLVDNDFGAATEKLDTFKELSNQKAPLSIFELNSHLDENTANTIIKGDINGNGAVESIDYTLLKRSYFGTFAISENVDGDVNENGEIDVMDYVLLKRSYFDTYELNKQNGNNESSTIVIETPPDDYEFSFGSYEDIKLAFTEASYDKYSDLRKAQQSYGNVYRQTLEAYESNKIKLLVPKFNGYLMKLRNQEGFSNISFMTCELYNLPWVWYFCKIDGFDLRVKVSNISIIDNNELRAAVSYTDVISLIAPNAPSPSNYKEYKSYKSIYETNIALDEGQTVKAMICELNESSKIYVMIYKDGALISLYADAELFSDSFWKSFDIAPY